MRWTSKSRDIFDWHPWWAWHPVCVKVVRATDGYYHSSWAWGTTVLRKAEPHWDGYSWVYQW